MVCKDKLNKNNLEGAKVADDGFAMGRFTLLNLSGSMSVKAGSEERQQQNNRRGYRGVARGAARPRDFGYKSFNKSYVSY